MKYRVISDLVHGFEPGEVIDAIPGANMAALVYGQHVEEIADEPKAKAKKGGEPE